MPSDRMFRVLVLGGISLVGGNACGGSVSANARDHDGASSSSLPLDASSRVDSDVDAGFPSETNASASNDAASEAGPDVIDATDAPLDEGRDATDAATCPPSFMKIGNTCFPGEGPPP